MRRRRLAPVLVAGSAAFVSAVAGASSDTERVSVKPVTVSPPSAVVVTFKAPADTGRDGSTLRGYRVDATGPADHSCASHASAPAGEVSAGQEVRVKLSPPDPSDLWCAGKFSGQVDETTTPVCAFRESCPADTKVHTIGRFSFHVRWDAGTHG